jgi:endonuclease/exonuclease/phosphatase family metal-dependent hydrolase
MEFTRRAGSETNADGHGEKSLLHMRVGHKNSGHYPPLGAKSKRRMGDYNRNALTACQKTIKNPSEQAIAEPMKIVSWNIYRRNRHLTRLPDFVRGLEADVVCLQEVPLNALPLLEGALPHMVACREFDPLKKHMETQLVILSKHPLHSHTRVEHGSPPATSLAARLSGKCMGKEFHFIDLSVHGQQVRIFNAHLPLKVPPSFRLAELDFMRKYLATDRHNFVCGDFNSFGGPLVNPAWGWFYGYRGQDYLIHERKRIERMMAAHGLVNPFGGKRTHHLLNIQLDYILLPQTLHVRQKHILRERCGSDHYPLLVEAGY